MDTSNRAKVELIPGPDGWVVMVNGQVVSGAAVVLIDGQRVDYIDGRIVVSTPSVDDLPPAAPPVRRIAL